MSPYGETADPVAATEFSGRTAVVTGAAGGIGLATAEAIMNRGGEVLGLDLVPSIAGASSHARWTGAQCDVTNPTAVGEIIESYVSRTGSIEMLVSNAGVFYAGDYVADLDLETWEKSLRVNLTSHFITMKSAIKYMKDGGSGSVVVVGSRNVQAPGPGAAAYSVAKAGLTQLARVAALELGVRGIRVNVVHPDAVFDTALWTQEALETSANRYGLTVDEYKKNNVLGTQVRPDDVGDVICALLGDGFSRTTGAQVPVDGGNARVI